jgi:intein-encoded DNA endonuclease-like protein
MNKIENANRIWDEKKDAIINLYNKGYGVHSLERMGYLSHNYLHQRLKAEGIKPNENSRSLSKVMIDLKPSEDLFYILGCCNTDASVFHVKHHQCANSKFSKIFLETKDKDFAIAFYKSCKKIGLNPNMCKHDRPKSKKGFAWRVESNSKVFVEWFKTLNYDYILNSEDILKIAFMRGVYDSDGCSINGSKITSTYLDFISFLKSLTDSLNIQTKIYCSKNQLAKNGVKYDLIVMTGKGERKKFLELIKPAMLRKRWKD